MFAQPHHRRGVAELLAGTRDTFTFAPPEDHADDPAALAGRTGVASSRLTEWAEADDHANALAAQLDRARREAEASPPTTVT